MIIVCFFLYKKEEETEDHHSATVLQNYVFLYILLLASDQPGRGSRRLGQAFALCGAAEVRV